MAYWRSTLLLVIRFTAAIAILTLASFTMNCFSVSRRFAIDLLAQSAEFSHRASNNSLLSATVLGHRVTNTSQSYCSFPLFRQHLLRSNATYLTGDGVWSRRHSANSFKVIDGQKLPRRRGPSPWSNAPTLGHLHRFQPNVCVYEYGAWIPRGLLGNCLCRKRLSYIVVTGDSNAERFFIAVNRLPCKYLLKTVAVARSNSSVNVYGPKLNTFECSVMCSDLSSQRQLMVQYLPMVSDWTSFQSYIVPDKTGCLTGTGNGHETTLVNASLRFSSSRHESYQEFLHSEFLAVDPSPDVVLHFSSSHEHSSLDEYTKKVEKFSAMLQRLSQKRRRQRLHNVRIVILSKPAEYLYMKPDFWKFLRYGPHRNMSRDAYVLASNRLLHDRIAPLFISRDDDESNDILLFPDLAAMMNPVLQDLAVDGVHSSTFWYQTLWSLIVQTLCRS